MGLSHAIGRLVLLPSAVGVVCSACGFTGESGLDVPTDVLNSELSAPVEAANVTTTEPDGLLVEDDSESADAIAAQEKQVIADQAAAYQAGINLASSAYNLSQSAVSPDDWGLVASRWQQASHQLKRVGASSDQYAAARTKIPEYEANGQYASSRIASLQAAASAPLTESQTPARLPRRSAQSSSTTTAEPARSQSGSSSTARLSGIAAGDRNISNTAASSADADNPAARSVIAVPTHSAVRVPVVRRLHGTPVVHVTFNDAKTYEMILDTGASRTLITRRMANELNVVPSDQMVAATASAAQVTFDLGQMRSISVGDVRLSNAQVSIGDSIEIGLLGNDFLRGYDVTIRDREVELVPSR